MTAQEYRDKAAEEDGAPRKDLFLAAAKRHGLRMGKIAEALGISRSTLWRKLENKSNFNLREYWKLQELMTPEEVSDILWWKQHQRTREEIRENEERFRAQRAAMTPEELAAEEERWRERLTCPVPGADQRSG